MAFPNTRHTLIERLATYSNDADWAEFMSDYWTPVCRFAQRQGGLSREDAEDIASLTFEVVFKKQLLGQWVSHRQAKLRTLLCAVVRNFISNHVRVRDGRRRLLRDHPDRFDEGFVLQDMNVSAEQEDQFYAAWVTATIQQALDQLMREYHAQGRGDYFRLLYGRLCERMTMRDIADSLGISTSTADNYYKHVRKRLGEILEGIVRSRVERYVRPAEVSAEFNAEWAAMARHLQGQQGLEAAVERIWASEESRDMDPSQKSYREARERLSAMFASPPSVDPAGP